MDTGFLLGVWLALLLPRRTEIDDLRRGYTASLPWFLGLLSRFSLDHGGRRGSDGDEHAKKFGGG